MNYDTTYEPADIIVHVQGRGIVVREKSLVAIRKSDNKYIAFGAEAERLAEGDMADMTVISPLHQGMIADYLVAVKLFSHLIVKALGKKPFRRPGIAVCVPKGINVVEKKAIEDAMIQSGARELFIADIPAEEFIREFPERFPEQYKKCMITVGITKEEPERYIEERLQDILDYAGQQQISRERVNVLLQKVLGNENKTV